LIKKPRFLPLVALSTLALVGSSLAASVPASAQVFNPCDRLSAGQVKYSGHGANRVTFATASHRWESRALVTSCVRSGDRYVQEWQVNGTVGGSGFKAPGVPSGHTMNLYSPTGSFSVHDAFGLQNPGTALSYRTLNPNSRWGGRIGPEYNRYLEYPELARWPDENLWHLATRPEGDYRQAVVIDYNRGPGVPIQQGDGFAIFLHANPVPTAGCIAIPEHMVTRFIQTAVPGDRIIMGAVDDVFTPYSSYPFGAIANKYTAMGGQLGPGNPTSNEVGGLRNGGAYQSFQRGSIAWSPSTGARLLTGAIRQKWQQLGSERGPLGYPTSEEVAGLAYGGAYQSFEGGAVLWSPASGAHVVSGGIRSAWVSQGSQSGKLGYPTTEEYVIPGGVAQDYQGGRIVWSPSTGAQILGGAMGTKYWAIGGPRTGLGYPVAKSVGGLAHGGYRQDFQGGTIVWSPVTGAYVSSGGVHWAWTSQGAQDGKLGYPLTDEYAIPGGMAQDYQGGRIVWSPSTGAQILGGAIGTKYWAIGGPRTGLGYPVAKSVGGLAAGGYAQDYQGGTILWSPASGAHPVTGEIRSTWVNMGGQDSFLGYPTTDETAGLAGGGARQKFQGGAVIKTPAGVFTSGNGTYGAWASQGFEAGGLGYPTSAEYVTAGGVMQDFQGGKIAWSPSTGARILTGAISDKYFAAGGPESSLGYPAGNATATVGGGQSQRFQNGEIVWNPATGAQIVTGGIRWAWISQGSEHGELGYPTTDEYVTEDGAAQDFQGGRITWTPAEGTMVQLGGAAAGPAETKPSEEPAPDETTTAPVPEPATEPALPSPTAPATAPAPAAPAPAPATIPSAEPSATAELSTAVSPSTRTTATPTPSAVPVP
jgi:uncharacterized protein with LGFP repeats/L,D-peptidoglycan transpeptidase YkuD (ErfK/YbiS/YcfS/YnhG family)